MRLSISLLILTVSVIPGCDETPKPVQELPTESLQPKLTQQEEIVIDYMLIKLKRFVDSTGVSNEVHEDYGNGVEVLNVILPTRREGIPSTINYHIKLHWNAKAERDHNIKQFMFRWQIPDANNDFVKELRDFLEGMGFHDDSANSQWSSIFVRDGTPEEFISHYNILEDPRFLSKLI